MILPDGESKRKQAGQGRSWRLAIRLYFLSPVSGLLPLPVLLACCLLLAFVGPFQALFRLGWVRGESGCVMGVGGSGCWPGDGVGIDASISNSGFLVFFFFSLFFLLAAPHLHIANSTVAPAQTSGIAPAGVPHIPFFSVVPFAIQVSLVLNTAGG